MLLQLWSLCSECVKAQRSSLNYSQNCHVGVQSATAQASQPPSQLVRLDSHTVGLIQLAGNPTACSSISLQLVRQPAVGPVAQAGVRCAGLSWPELAEHQGRRLQLSAEGGVEPGCAGKTCTLVQMLVLSLNTTKHDYWNIFVNMSESQLKPIRTFIIMCLRCWSDCLHVCTCLHRAAVLQVLYLPTLQGLIFKYAVWAGPWLRPRAEGGS